MTNRWWFQNRSIAQGDEPQDTRQLSLRSAAGALLASVAMLPACSDGSLGPMDMGNSVGQGDGDGDGDGDIVGDGDGDGDIVGDGDGDGDEPLTPPAEIPGGVELKGEPAFHGVVRLTHAQWANSIESIFGIDATSAKSSLHPDPPKGKFTNNELALYVEGELWTDYQRVSEQLAEQIAGDSAVTSRFGGIQDSDAFIDRVGQRLFRRALSAEEKAAYSDAWSKGATYYASGDDAVDGARVFLEAALQSPLFLYRVEVEQAGNRLPGYALATKLSLLLTDTLPDEDLLNAAAAGELDTDDGLTSVATEMLTDESAREALNRFHSELYGIDRYKNIRKSATLFPSYSEDLNSVLIEADMMFFGNIYESGGGFRDVLLSDVAYVNAQTAGYYGVNATGPQLTQTTLGPDRPGFLTRLGFLSYNATLADPDPIHRGVDINKRMLCADLEPPSGTIPPLPEPEPDQTNRERVMAHTGQGGCANCHLKVINPPGFAFENFDAMGQVRTIDNGQPIDTADEYRFNDDIYPFKDAPELIQTMAEHPQTHGCYAANLAEFILARDVAGTEEELVTAMQSASYDSDASLKELILMMVTDPLFTTAYGGTQ